MIDKKKLIEKINTRLNKQPKSRVGLGGYHTGEANAYKNIIDDIKSGELDYIDKRKKKRETVS